MLIPVILSGGADACVTPGMIFGFSRMRAVATRYNDSPEQASRPFDRARNGMAGETVVPVPAGDGARGE